MGNRWRINYVINYADSSVADRERAAIDAVLKTVARLLEIELVILTDPQEKAFSDYNSNKVFANSVADLACFRFSQNTLIQPKDFRKMIDSIFLNHQHLKHANDFEVFPQLQEKRFDCEFP